jgi:hypothetical protein
MKAMPKLTDCNSIFQLAFGMNAVLPAVIADFEFVRNEVADSLLRKIKECLPQFELKERDRIDFVDFTLRSSRGLRHARTITRLTAFISVAFCAISLVALCLSALNPEAQLSRGWLFAFVATTLVVGPLFYIARNSFLKWLYKTNVIHGTNEKKEAVLYAECVNAYLDFKKGWTLDRTLGEGMAQISVMMWRMRLTEIKIILIRVRYWILSKAILLKHPRVLVRRLLRIRQEKDDTHL